MATFWGYRIDVFVWYLTSLLLQSNPSSLSTWYNKINARHVLFHVKAVKTIIYSSLLLSSSLSGIKNSTIVPTAPTACPSKAPSTQDTGHCCHGRSQSNGITTAPNQAPIKMLTVCIYAATSALLDGLTTIENLEFIPLPTLWIYESLYNLPVLYEYAHIELWLCDSQLIHYREDSNSRD